MGCYATRISPVNELLVRFQQESFIRKIRDALDELPQADYWEEGKHDGK